MRYPAVAGRFYSDSKDALTEEIRDCFTHAIGPGLPGGCRNERKITSAIAPHAGYAASGMNAAHVYKAIAEDGLPEAYVIIGPDHRGIPYDVALCGVPYVTPLGVCSVHDDIVKKLRKIIPDDPRSHRYEHSVEVQIPFIQYIDPNAKIVPIIMGDQSRECAKFLSEAITEACTGHDTVVIASSDLSHYVSKKRAHSEGTDVLNKVCALDIPGMYGTIEKRDITACGYGPMAVAMSAGCSSAELLKYSDSEDSLGLSGEVVAYASVAFRR
ncbi:MAG: AmmeMemoRadiSam system protein B [Methanomassiliicoccaceae archaeon]|jgi:AmmeMemoRadiSam system protein B|nr:AmmeMemoRadiSam system protein B [Methanomassiliicoccaceae archaeon]